MRLFWVIISTNCSRDLTSVAVLAIIVSQWGIMLLKHRQIDGVKQYANIEFVNYTLKSFPNFIMQLKPSNRLAFARSFCFKWCLVQHSWLGIFISYFLHDFRQKVKLLNDTSVQQNPHFAAHVSSKWADLWRGKNSQRSLRPVFLRLFASNPEHFLCRSRNLLSFAGISIVEVCNFSVHFFLFFYSLYCSLQTVRVLDGIVTTQTTSLVHLLTSSLFLRPLNWLIYQFVCITLLCVVLSEAISKPRCFSGGLSICKWHSKRCRHYAGMTRERSHFYNIKLVLKYHVRTDTRSQSVDRERNREINRKLEVDEELIRLNVRNSLKLGALVLFWARNWCIWNSIAFSFVKGRHYSKNTYWIFK